jgi:membrane protein implicated in regulation of membrane protease activity
VALGWAVKRVLRSSDGVLNPDDYRLVGTIGRVTSSIRPDGFGEIVYEQAGTRHVAAARAAGVDGIGRGVEVIVLRLERGVAIVQPWDELLATSGTPAAPAPELETVERERR